VLGPLPVAPANPLSASAANVAANSIIPLVMPTTLSAAVDQTPAPFLVQWEHLSTG